MLNWNPPTDYRDNAEKMLWWADCQVFFHLTVEIDVGLPPVVCVDRGLEQAFAAGQPQPVVEERGSKEGQGLELCPGKEDLSSHAAS